MSEVDLLLAHISRTLGDLRPNEEGNYSSLPTCVVDAIYSIGVRYESTSRTVDNFCKWAKWEDNQEHRVATFLRLLRPYKSRWEALANEVFRNRQQTSSRSGILKAEAVYWFAKALSKWRIDCLADITAIESVDHLWTDVAAIPGQSSGISFKYFLMLAGYSELVKPDRMLIRFVAHALGKSNVSPETAERLVRSAADSIQTQRPYMTASLLDYHIWRHQRGLLKSSCG